jgi:hypothetical protein
VATDDDWSAFERLVTMRCDSAGDDHIDQGCFNAGLVLAIIFDHGDPQGGVRRLVCKKFQPS